MKPLWQYWVEVVFRAILAVALCFGVILVAGWLVIAIGGPATAILVGFLGVTFIIAVVWSVTDTDHEHMKPWFHKNDE